MAKERTSPLVGTRFRVTVSSVEAVAIAKMARVPAAAKTDLDMGVIVVV